jgi:DNA polymerase (family 10)
MNNAEIAAVFRDISALLEKKKDNWFKIRTYRKAADSIEGLSVPVGQLVDDGTLKEIPGVGEAITKKITELVTTGNLEYYERLKTELREGTD